MTKYDPHNNFSASDFMAENTLVWLAHGLREVIGEFHKNKQKITDYWNITTIRRENRSSRTWRLFDTWREACSTACVLTDR